MANERRNNSRMPIELDAVLNYQASAVICTIRDLSVTGAFIEGAPEDLPFSGQKVELALTLNSKGQPKSFRLPAVIRRVTDSGVGVSFSDIDQETYFSLVDVVFPAQPGTNAHTPELPVARLSK
jgi:hypothetical protein